MGAGAAASICISIQQRCHGTGRPAEEDRLPRPRRGVSSQRVRGSRGGIQLVRFGWEQRWGNASRWTCITRALQRKSGPGRSRISFWLSTLVSIRLLLEQKALEGNVHSWWADLACSYRYVPVSDVKRTFSLPPSSSSSSCPSSSSANQPQVHYKLLLNSDPKGRFNISYMLIIIDNCNHLCLYFHTSIVRVN